MPSGQGARSRDCRSGCVNFRGFDRGLRLLDYRRGGEGNGCRVGDIGCDSLGLDAKPLSIASIDVSIEICSLGAG